MRRTWVWAIERDIFITAAHIPGILNVDADQKSRESALRTKCKIHESIFGHIKKDLGFYPSNDLFAFRINSQLPYFFIYCPDQKADVTKKAFCVSRQDLSFYCFLPFSCIGKLLKNIICDNATGILIVSNWQSVLVYRLARPIIDRSIYLST